MKRCRAGGRRAGMIIGSRAAFSTCHCRGRAVPVPYRLTEWPSQVPWLAPAAVLRQQANQGGSPRQAALTASQAGIDGPPGHRRTGGNRLRARARPAAGAALASTGRLRTAPGIRSAGPSEHDEGRRGPRPAGRSAGPGQRHSRSRPRLGDEAAGSVGRLGTRPEK